MSGFFKKYLGKRVRSTTAEKKIKEKNAFDKRELAALEATYSDLASRSNLGEANIDKDNFLKFFNNVPGMLGERLFQVFDTEHTHNVSFAEFRSGLFSLFRGTQEDRLRFIFSMFAMKTDKTVDRQDLTTMLNSVLFVGLTDTDSREELDAKVAGLVDSGMSMVPETETGMTLYTFGKWMSTHAWLMGMLDELLAVREREFALSMQEHATHNPRARNPRSSISSTEVPGQERALFLINSEREGKRWTGHTVKCQTCMFELQIVCCYNCGKRLQPDGKAPSSPSHTYMHSPSKLPPASTADASLLSRACSTQQRTPSRNTSRHSNSSPLHYASGAMPTQPTLPLTPPAESPVKGLKSRTHSERSAQSDSPVLRSFSYRGGLDFLAVAEDRSVGAESIVCESCGPIFLRNWVSFCLQCGSQLCAPGGGGPVEPSLLQPVGSTGVTKHQGYMLKVGARFGKLLQRYFVIRDQFLYTYHKESDIAKHRNPTNVLFLEGCFVESVNHEEKSTRMKFGVEIIITEQPRRSRFLYCDASPARAQWMAALQNAANVHEISAYYDIGEDLGVGKFSRVKLGVNKNNKKTYAIKILEKNLLDEKEREALRTEVAILRLVRHPNIVRLKNVFETRRRIHIVMSYVSGGDLFDKLAKHKRFSELHCQRLIRRLLEVVSYLHGRGIVHRDLKPENIMVASSADAPHTLTPPSTRTALGGPSESKFDELDGFGQPPTIPEHEYVPRGGADDLEDLENIMVGDFGLSKFATPQELMQQPCGTIAYVAPEVLAKTGYGKEVDLWSVGVITFLCLSGKLPFASKDQETIVALTLAGRVEFDHPAFRSAHPSCVDFIQGLLQIDPAARMDALQALQHPWMHVDLAAGESGSDSARPSLGSPPLSTRTSTSSVGSSLHRMVTVDQQHLKYARQQRGRVESKDIVVDNTPTLPEVGGALLADDSPTDYTDSEVEEDWKPLAMTSRLSDSD